MGDRHSFLTQPRVLETIQNVPGPALDGHPSLRAVYLGLKLCSSHVRYRVMPVLLWASESIYISPSQYSEQLVVTGEALLV